jgi:glycerophosphoryl diester phosphodiesterase
MKKIVILLLLLLQFIACKKKDYNIVNLNGNKISVLGHGGMGLGHIYPMNSLESILCSLNLGADGTEMDVEMTADSVLIAFHDMELSSRTNMSGNVYEKNWGDIKHAKYNDQIYVNFKIVTLDEIFSNLGNNTDKLFSLDCKNFNPDTSAKYRNTFCNALLKFIDKYNIQDHVTIELKREDIIKTLKKLRPNLKIYALFEFDKALQLANQYQLQGIVISVDKISKEQVSIAHQNGLKVIVANTHSNQRNIEAIHKNVDVIETDNLKHLLKVLK